MPRSGANSVPISDLTEKFLESGGLVLTATQLGQQTLVTVMATNPFQMTIEECKIIIIDNPTTREYGPMPLLVGGSLVFTTLVSSSVTIDDVRVMGSVP